MGRTFTSEEVASRKKEALELLRSKNINLDNLVDQIMDDILEKYQASHPGYQLPQPKEGTSEYDRFIGAIGNRMELIRKMVLLAMSPDEIEAYFPEMIPLDDPSFMEQEIPELMGVTFTEAELYPDEAPAVEAAPEHHGKIVKYSDNLVVEENLDDKEQGLMLYENNRKVFQKLVIFCAIGWSLFCFGIGLVFTGTSLGGLGLSLMLGGFLFLSLPFIKKLRAGFGLAALMAGTVYVTTTTYTDGSKKKEYSSGALAAIVMIIICFFISILIMLINLIKLFFRAGRIVRKYKLKGMIPFKQSIWVPFLIGVGAFAFGILAGFLGSLIRLPESEDAISSVSSSVAE